MQPARKQRPGRPQTRKPIEIGSRVLLMGVELLKVVARLPLPAALNDIAQSSKMTPSRAYR
jgi:hypothetical protein